MDILGIGLFSWAIRQQSNAESDDDADDVARVLSGFAAQPEDEFGIVGYAPPTLDKNAMRAPFKSRECDDVLGGKRICDLLPFRVGSRIHER